MPDDRSILLSDISAMLAGAATSQIRTAYIVLSQICKRVQTNIHCFETKSNKNKYRRCKIIENRQKVIGDIVDMLEEVDDCQLQQFYELLVENKI